MKKNIKTILTMLVVMTMLLQAGTVIFASDSAGTEDTTSYPLITHWDFNGFASADRLKDHATAGNSQDELFRTGTNVSWNKRDDGEWEITVEAENTDTVNNGSYEYLYATSADESSDIYSMANKTIVMSAKLSGNLTSVAGIATKADVFSYGVTADRQSRPYIGRVENASNEVTMDTPQNLDSTNTAIPMDEYRVFVISFDYRPDDNSFTVRMYVSTVSTPTSVEHFTLVETESYPINSTTRSLNLENTNPLVFGRRHDHLERTDRNLTTTFDDIKIYDGVMTPKDVVTEGQAPVFRGVQIAKNGSSVTEANTFAVRMVGTINNNISDLSEIGFKVTTTTYNESGEIDRSGKCYHLYNSISADTTNGHKEYSAKTDFHSKYLYAYTIKNIPLGLITVDGGYVEFTVTPYTNLYEGETVKFRVTYDNTKTEDIEKYIVTYVTEG